MENRRKSESPASSMPEAIRLAYEKGQEDEALEPIVRVDDSGTPVGRIGEGDSVVFYDVRGEREIELTESLTDPGFRRFPVKKDLKLNFVTMIEYATGLRVKVAFPPEQKLKNTLTEVLCRSGFRVVKISESEKAVHVSFFFNGKREEAFPGEKRVVVPSPQVEKYSDVPGMSAEKVAEAVARELGGPGPRVIIANLANVDVVGHIENKAAVLRAVESVDAALGRIFRAAKSRGATLIVVSDHGTVEEWLYPDGAVNTGHTGNPVPFVLADFSLSDPAEWTLRDQGELADVAPTVIDLAGVSRPSEMTGRSLVLKPPLFKTPKNKILILILDGWGLREELEGNLIAEADTGRFDELWMKFPHLGLQSSGEAVGMPPGSVGNSEAGHLHLGAGRRVLLDRVRIDRAIEDGAFFKNEELLWAMEEARNKSRPLHLMGIVSHYSSHGTIRHLFALLRMAKEAGVLRVFVHSFIGRRGEKPESGAIYVGKVEEACREAGLGDVVTVMGRHWSLDREGNWDRIEKAYRSLVYGEGTKVYPGEENRKLPQGN